ncbi:MAG: NAD(+)/NADH kinase [Candidatus Woesearchaeota archaeon]
MRIRSALVVYSFPGCPTLKQIAKVLQERGIRSRYIYRTKTTKKMFNADLVITEGGDGTFLRATHFAKDTPILSVNCDREKNEGFYSRADRFNFQERIDRMLAGTHKITNLWRLEATIDKRKILELAVNEIFIGDRNVHHTAKYWLFGELQKSSGVIVAAPAGTNAWYKSAGGKPIPITEKKFGYIVREPYRGRLYNPKKLQGVLTQKDKLTVHSGMHDGMLVIDGVSKEYKFDAGSKATIRLSRRPLHFVEF